MADHTVIVRARIPVLSGMRCTNTEYRGLPKLEHTLELWNRFILTRTPPKVYLFGLDQYIHIYSIYVLGIYIPYIYIHDTYIYTVYHYIYIPE